MSDVTVGPVRPADLPELAELAARTFPLACPPGTTREQTDLFVATHLSPDALRGYLDDEARHLLLARRDGAAVGYTMMVDGDPADPDVAAVVTDRPTVELSKCYVDADVHGTGVAAQLVDAALAAARAEAMRTCWLGVNQHNVRAQRFYAKHGFVVVGNKTFDVGGALHDDFVMVRSLVDDAPTTSRLGFLGAPLHNGGVDTTTDVLGDAWTARTFRLKDDRLTRRTGVEPVATLVSQRDVDPARVAVLHVHGFVDYFFHDHLAAPLADAGYQLYGLDLRDCGRSARPERPINDTDNLARYTEEVDRAVRELALVHSKVVVAGHSTGGLTAALWADARPYLVSRGTLAALVLNSPWLDLRAGRWAKTAVSAGVDVLGRVAPRTVVTHLGEHYGRALHRSGTGEWDYDLAWKAYDSAPVTAGFVRSVRRAQARVAHGLDIGCPVLVMASGASSRGDRPHDALLTTDCVVDVADIERLAPRLGADVTFKQVDGGAHDLSLSPPPAREAFVATVIDFLDARVTA